MNADGIVAKVVASCKKNYNETLRLQIAMFKADKLYLGDWSSIIFIFFIILVLRQAELLRVDIYIRN